jgi:hypothetical protein
MVRRDGGGLGAMAGAAEGGLAVDAARGATEDAPRSAGWAASAHPVGERLSEPPTTAADRLVAHGNAKLRQEVFDVSIAEQEAVVQPNRVANELAREAEALVER